MKYTTHYAGHNVDPFGAQPGPQMYWFDTTTESERRMHAPRPRPDPFKGLIALGDMPYRPPMLGIEQVDPNCKGCLGTGRWPTFRGLLHAHYQWFCPCMYGREAP